MAKSTSDTDRLENEGGPSLVDQNDAAATASDEVEPQLVRRDADPEPVPDEKPQVQVKLADDYEIPVLEEVTAEDGRVYGKHVGDEHPDEVTISRASGEPVVLTSSPIDVPADVAADIQHSPAVEVVR